jgi:predicted ATPase/DNA-binding XRE family transcriptional regulator
MTVAKSASSQLAPVSFQTFGELLKYLRRRSRLTQGELALAVGYSREQITRLENNQRLPDLTVLKALFLPALELEQQPALAELFLHLAEAAHSARSGEVCPEVGTGSPAQTNLPASLTSFIGREAELAKIKRLLQGTRLLALTGAGGAGKTRLALQVGLELLADFRDGVWLVELASLTDPAHLSGTVATALGVSVFLNSAPEVALANYLQDKTLLLILDNCEHLLVACAHLAESLLRAAPHLQILATSRQNLGILSATAYHVPSLSLSPLERDLPVEDWLQAEAIRLFEERAATARPSFSLTPANAQAVAQICYRLDGMPLAIELAATQVRLLSVEQIAVRLDDRFRLLTSGNATALPRHQTLRALIDWSYELLSPLEQALWRHFAVFAGDWTLEAAEVMADDLAPTSTLALLSQLVDKSLVVVVERNQESRYRLLETLREYGREKLAQAGEEAQARDRHLAFYVTWLEQANSHLPQSRQKSWYERLETELDNLRAALGWAIRSNQPEAGLRLVAGLWFFWFRRGYWQEGREWARTILALPPVERSQTRARALIGGASLARRSDDWVHAKVWLAEGVALARELGELDYLAWARLAESIRLDDEERAQSLLGEGLTLARQIGNTWLMANILFILGERARAKRADDQAAAYYRESISLFRQVGDRDMIANPMGNLGRLAFRRGEYSQARSAFAESIELYRELGNIPGIADWLLQLATVALYQADYPQARIALSECLSLCHHIGNVEAVADCLVIAAGLAEAEGRWERAARLLAAADKILQDFGVLHRVADPSSYAEYIQRLATVQAQLPKPAFMAAWAVGTEMSMAQAIEDALK